MVHPSESLVFADAGEVTAQTVGLNPDQWAEVKATGDTGGAASTFFNVPSFFGYPNDAGYRSVPRHSTRVSTVWFDGHAEAVRNSKIGYGFPKGDPGALWDKY